GNVGSDHDSVEFGAAGGEPRLSCGEKNKRGTTDAADDGDEARGTGHHGAILRSELATAIARRGAAAFARVSSNSACGSDSATIPAPACTRATESEIVVVRIVIAR